VFPIFAQENLLKMHAVAQNLCITSQKDQKRACRKNGGAANPTGAPVPSLRK
jgi:hypothetical protein